MSSDIDRIKLKMAENKHVMLETSYTYITVPRKHLLTTERVDGMVQTQMLQLLLRHTMSRKHMGISQTERGD